jgi:hypothetical protein
MVQTIDPSQTLFTLGVKYGQTLPGPALIGSASFKASPGESGFVPLDVNSGVGAKADGTIVGNASENPGWVVVIGAQPLLEAWLSTNQYRMLILYGNPSASYQMGYRTNLPGTNWHPVRRILLTNMVETFAADEKTPLLFYRAWEFFAGPPILELAGSSPTNFTLLLYGKSGTNYILQASTNLYGPSWFPATDFTLTNSFGFIDTGSPTNRMMFFRTQGP